MDRREALRVLGAATATTSFFAWEPDDLVAALHEHHQGQQPPKPAPQKIQVAYKFRTLDPHQRATVAELSEMIIPATETPGAKAAKVDEFVDIILTDWSTEGERSEFVGGLADLDVRATKVFGKTFISGAPDQRTALLTEMDAELTAVRTARRAWRRTDGTPQPPDHRKLFFHQIRSFTVSGYYSSEPGYKLERKNAIVPGIYKHCTPVEAS